MLEMMFILLCDAFLLITCCVLVHNFVPERRIKIYFKSLICLLWMGFGVIFCFLFQDNIFLIQGFHILINILFVMILYRINAFWAFLLISLFYGGHLALEYLAFALCFEYFSFLPESFSDFNSYPLFTLKLICHLVLFYFAYTLKMKNPKKDFDFLMRIDWAKYAVFPVFTILVIIILDYNFTNLLNQNQSISIICISCGLLIMNSAVFCILKDAIYREALAEEDYLFKERARQETKIFESMREQYNIQKKSAHEFKNHITCLSALSKNADYEKLQEYIDTIQDSMDRQMDFYDVSNKLINIIINAKYQEAREKNILFILKANDLSSLKMKDRDIVVLISNLLNNAFEASDFCPEKEIKVKMICENDRFILSVQNRYAHEPVKVDGRFLSIKDNPLAHGVGMENAVDVIKKYNGSYTVHYDEKWFYFSAIIQN